MPEKTEPVKRGNSAGFKFFELVIRYMGVVHARRIAAIVCFYYVLFDRRAVKSAEPVIRHLHPDCGIFSFYLRVWRLFSSQAGMLVDRAANSMGLFEFKHTFEKYDSLVQMHSSATCGTVVVCSHFGNWQLSLDTGGEKNFTINVLVNQEMNEAVRKSLKLNQPLSNLNFIFTDGLGSGMLEVASVLCRNEIVFLMGDRPYGAPVVEVDFLGEKAYFPYSAYVIAAKTSSLVLTMFVCYDKVKGIYRVECGEPVFPVSGGRKVSAQESYAPYVQAYARELESYMRKYPEQAFLFSDVWTGHDKNNKNTVQE